MIIYGPWEQHSTGGEDADDLSGTTYTSGATHITAHIPNVAGMTHAYVEKGTLDSGGYTTTGISEPALAPNSETGLWEPRLRNLEVETAYYVRPVGSDYDLNAPP